MRYFNITKLLLGGILLLSLSACNKEPADAGVTTPATANFTQKDTGAQLYAELQKVSEEGNLEKVRQLIKQGANVNLLVWDKTSGDDENDVYASYQETPLMLASEKGYLDVVKELLAAGANVNQILPINTEREMIPGEAFTALEKSCRPDNMKVVKTLASAGTNAQSVLICACLCGDEELLQIALQKKPNLNFTSGEGGVSPLIMAAGSGDENIVRALLQAGADPNYTDPFIETDYTALQAARDYPEIVELLKSYGAKEQLKDTFALAVQRGDVQQVTELLKQGTNPNQRIQENLDSNSEPALCNAIESARMDYSNSDDYEKIAILLLQAGANPNVNCSGSTPLTLASLSFSLIDALIKAGADVNAKDWENETALKLAQEAGNTKIVELLKQAGAKE